MSVDNDFDFDFDTAPAAEDSNTNVETITEIRAELIPLAEQDKIPYTVKYIKKSGQKNLERIRTTYKLKQLEATNIMMSEHLIKKIAEMLVRFKIILKEDALELTEELLTNPIIMEDIKSTVGSVTVDMPHMGCICAAVILSKYLFKNNDTDPSPTPEVPKQDDEFEFNAE